MEQVTEQGALRGGRNLPALIAPAEEPSEFDRSFEELWSTFPRKEKRREAQDIFRRLVAHGADATAIVEGGRRYAEDRAGKEPRFILTLPRWLSAERWTDEFTKPSGPSGLRGAPGWLQHALSRCSEDEIADEARRARAARYAREEEDYDGR